jgi:hypothetical protein
MYLTKYQNLRIGFHAYFKNIPRKSYPNFVGFHQSQLQAILPKKGSHFENENEKTIKIYVLDIAKYFKVE